MSRRAALKSTDAAVPQCLPLSWYSAEDLDPKYAVASTTFSGQFETGLVYFRILSSILRRVSRLGALLFAEALVRFQAGNRGPGNGSAHGVFTLVPGGILST
jgi:hypothetical protein